MKRSGKSAGVLLLAALLALAASCASTDIDALDKNGNPIWTSGIPVGLGVLYGVGGARFSNQDNSRDAADANARADLAKKISVTMKEFVSQYRTEAAGAEAYEKLTAQIVDLTLKEVKVERRWVSPEGKAWTLVSIKTKNLPDCYDHAQENYARRLEAEKAEVGAKLAQLLEKTGKDDAPGKDVIEALAKKKAADRTAELDEALGALGKLATSKELGSFLAGKGL